MKGVVHLPDIETIKKKKRLVISYIRENSSTLIVALSGGVDSAVLLWLAAEALGKNHVLAVTGQSASFSAEDLADAEAVVRHLGVDWKVLKTKELDRPEYRANTGDRCYHCRTELFEVLGDWARSHEYKKIAYGAITDDQGDYRPGMTAAGEAGALAPLLEAGLSKKDIRVLAEHAGLPVKDKPAAACLSSRIPIGIEVTPERLAQVEKAEAGLRALGFGQLRVRHHGEIARIELDPDGEQRIQDPGIRSKAAQLIQEAGFRFAALDLQGFRSGSLNPPVEKRPTLYRIAPDAESGQ
jgi:uncharacterized protein